jgi:regulator of RNase E activity RraA
MISQATLDILRMVRTSDVTDALDSLGMMNTYEMHPRIRPLFPGIKFAGIATTAAFREILTPTSRMTYDELSFVRSGSVVFLIYLEDIKPVLPLSFTFTLYQV